MESEEVWVLRADVDYNDWMVLGVFSSAEKAMDSVKEEIPEGWMYVRGAWRSVGREDHIVEKFVIDGDS